MYASTRLFLYSDARSPDPSEATRDPSLNSMRSYILARQMVGARWNQHCTKVSSLSTPTPNQVSTLTLTSRDSLRVALFSILRSGTGRASHIFLRLYACLQHYLLALHPPCTLPPAFYAPYRHCTYAHAHTAMHRFIISTRMTPAHALHATTSTCTTPPTAAVVRACTFPFSFLLSRVIRGRLSLV